MDKICKNVISYALGSGDITPLTYDCRDCGQETLNRVFCEDCIPKYVWRLMGSGISETESYDQLYQLEIDSWYAANGL